MSSKKYYWIKLKTDFFNMNEIDFLMSQKNGCEYVVLYQMLCLNTANTNGVLENRIGEMIIPYDLDKIVRDTKYFDYDTVVVALELYKKLGLIYEDNNNCLTIANHSEMVGSETTGAKRIREWRKKQELLESGNIQEVKKVPKSNAIRQKQHRAKKNCEQKQHIPYIEDYINNKRYNGNYYVVIQRDKYKCAKCGSIENLCVHHIDGYDENKPQNSEDNKMITLCRCCHSNIHAGEKIDEDILNSIDYYIDSNEMLLCNKNVIDDVTQENRDKSLDIRDKDIKDIDKENNTPTPSKSKKTKPQKHKHGEFQHVLLTDDEFERLKKDFNFYEELIKKLDEYIETSGKRYKNHNLVLRGWVLNWYNEQGYKTSRKEVEPNWLNEKPKPKEETLEDKANKLYKMWEVQLKCNQLDQAQETAKQYKELTGKDIEVVSKELNEAFNVLSKYD